jgi:hypothetical protein
MYSPAFQMLLIDARREDLRRARGISLPRHRGHEERKLDGGARWSLLGRVRLRGLLAAASSATWSPRS